MPTTIMNRRELLDLVWGRHRHGVQDSSEIEPAAQAGQEMTVIWREEDVSPGGTLPRVITMLREAHSEFLAWAYTYLAVLRPFTAFIRLLEPAMASELLQRSRVQDLGRLREAFVALIIGETVTHLGLRQDFLQHLTPNACANSRSYALARAVALGFEQQIEEVSSAWCSVRDLTKQRQREHNLGDLKTAFQVLSGCRERQATASTSMPLDLGLFERACREIADAGDIKDETWSDLTGSWASLFKIRGQMVESRESRVRAFDKAWTTIAEISQANPTLASFISGYLGSRIAPGELEHAGVVARTLEAAPGALLWFGVCSGLRSDGQVLAFSGGLGRRILRDLEQASHVLDRPRCDLAIAELEVLLNRDKPLTDFRAGSNSSLTVELTPGVTTTVRWPRPSDTQADLFERRDISSETRDLVRDLSVALERVDYLRKRLERAVDLDIGTPRGRSDQKPRKRW
ncbi:MAG: hypothetical protein AAB403_04195 [Planctomycetota bacterium]